MKIKHALVLLINISLLNIYYNKIDFFFNKNMMTTLDINLQKTDLIIELLLKIGPKYVWWNDTMEDCGPQAYARDINIVNFDIIKKTGINCVGLINIIRRCLELDIPAFETSNYAGGTYEWYKYLKKNKKLKKFDLNAVYPNGTLLIRKYKSAEDQGHVAVIYKSNSTDVLKSKLLHAYSYRSFTKNDLYKKIEPGLIIDDKIETSHSWYEDGTYTHICLPENWMI